MIIKNITKNTVLASTARIADTPLARMQGLLGRKNLLPGEALVITGCQSIHMMFMKFALDVVFVNKDNQVVGLCAQIQPFQLSPLFFKASKAIELPVGIIATTLTQLGDFLQID